MRKHMAIALILGLLLVGLTSHGQEAKSPTLDDDFKALQGKWGTPDFSLGFRDKMMRLDLGGDAGAAFYYRLEQKDKKRYLVFDEADVKPVPKFPREVAYAFDGKQMILTVEEEGKSIVGRKELKLSRAGSGKKK